MSKPNSTFEPGKPSNPRPRPVWPTAAKAAPGLREALVLAAAIIEASPAEDTCRHGNDVFECDEPCPDRSRREVIAAALAAPSPEADPATERRLAAAILDLVERRGEEWFDGMRWRGEYLDLAAGILSELSRAAAHGAAGVEEA